MCKNNIICTTLREDVLRSRAEQLFLLMSGFSRANPPTKYQREDIESVWQFIAQKIQIDVFLKPVLQYSFSEDYMILESERIFYNLPLSEYQEQITGVFAYVISEQTIAENGQGTLEQLYTHIWQNAYLDAAREWLKEWIGQKWASFVSQSIAPGFYGIALEEMKKFYEIAGGQQTTVRLVKNEMLHPEKSVLGIHLTLKEHVNILGRQCANCPARGKNCEFCVNKL